MKRISTAVLIVLLVLFTANLLQAAEPQTQKGSQHVYYTMSGLSNLGIDGSFIGYGKFIKDRLAVFADLSFALKSEKPGDDLPDEKNNGYNVRFGLEYYLMQKGSVAFSLVPLVGLGGSSRENVEYADYKVSENTLSVGCVLAVEWWVTREISLWGGAYVGYENTSGTKDYTSAKTDYTITRLGFLSSGPSLGIDFYF